MDATHNVAKESHTDPDFSKGLAVTILVGVIGFVALPILMSRAFWVEDGRSRDDLVVFALLPTIYLYLMLFCLLVLGRASPRFVTLDYAWFHWTRSEAKRWLLLPLGLLLIAGVMSPFFYILHLPHQSFVSVHNDNHGMPFASIRVIQGVLIAPVLEELLWRGYVQGTLVRVFGAWTGIIGQASLFAFMHFEPLMGTIQLFLMGLLFGVWRHSRQTILPLILTHMLNNALHALTN
jgi:membrane protease YdiL (CAAX protease family)